MWGLLFPGQGSQHIGMGQYLYENFKSTQELFEEASDTLSIDFKKLCFEGSEQDLALTENTQPCLLLTSVCTYHALRENTSLTAPKAAAGHSVGEYAAVVTAGSLAFSEALTAVRKRGEYMQSAVPVGEGAMLAILGLTPDQVSTVCEWTTKESSFSPIEPANFNAPGQVVVSGSAQALNWLRDNFKSEILNPTPRRVRFIPLNVSAPFHCSMMKPSEEKMKSLLSEMNFTDSQWPIVQNVTATMEQAADTLRSNLITQVSAPVRWTECVEALQSQGLNQFIECGPGEVIKGLLKKIDSELNCFNLNSLENFKQLEGILNG